MAPRNEEVIDLLFAHRPHAIDAFLERSGSQLVDVKRGIQDMYIKYTFRKDYGYPFYIDLLFAYKNPDGNLLLTWWGQMHFSNRPNNEVFYRFSDFLLEHFGYTEEDTDNLFNVNLEEVLNLDSHNAAVTRFMACLETFLEVVGQHGERLPKGKFQGIMDYATDPTKEYPDPRP